jgi:hypothetical protein
MSPQARRVAKVFDPSSPKTTRPAAIDRRPPPSRTAERATGHKLDAMPDRIDIRDWPYMPTLAPLPPQVVNIERVPQILDQGREGACTGYGLAGLINFQLASRGIRRFVSPRMLYEMARKYDEWPGEKYNGSSARGAMIGWVRHGVCFESTWPANQKGAGHFDDVKATEARRTPGGAYYRVMHTQVRDVHAAIAELGAIYMTIMVHGGWDKPGPTTFPLEYPSQRAKKKVNLPVITRQGRADDGHAVVVVGYTRSGFIIQNSWSVRWGYNGFALLPYEDFMLHATDVWAAQLGVPVDVDVWQGTNPDETAGRQRAASAIPLADIRPFTVDCGNNGKLSDSGDYWTTEEDIERLFNDTIPSKTRTWDKRRVLVYLHGGLNTEEAAANRVVAFRDVMLENQIYPLHLMWESGAAETIADLIKNQVEKPDERAGGMADWVHKLRDHLVEAKDRTFEITTARLGAAMWGDMKRNARLSSTSVHHDGAMQLIAKHAQAAATDVSPQERAKWEFHVVAHSAGSIYFAYALQHFLAMKNAGITFGGVHFMAPAMTTALFKQIVVPVIQSGDCPIPSLFILSDLGERDDNVGPYGKSLLYLVSNAFEGQRDVPLLGMERFMKGDLTISNLFTRDITPGIPSLVIAGAAPVNRPPDPFSVSRSESHGGFDNDPDTMNSILRRVLAPPNGKLKREFTDRDLQFA